MTSVRDLAVLLDHGAVDRSVPDADVQRQLKTAAALRRRLDRFNGVILGDEVGSGKTFVAFALLAHALVNDPRKGALVLVPTDQLETKWERQMREYFRAAVRDKRLQARLEGRIRRATRYSLHSIKPNALVIGRHSLFSYQTSKHDCAAAIYAYLSGVASPRPFRRFLLACGLDPDDVNPRWSSWADQNMLERNRSLLRPLDDVYRQYMAGDRSLKSPMRHAVQQIRLGVGRRLLPNASLVVIDEAHNLRSTHSSVYQALMRVLDGKFESLLFLTATPFQLGRHELRNIIEFFRYARGHDYVRGDFDDRVSKLEVAMDRYMEALDALAWQWRSLDPAESFGAVTLIQGGESGPASKTMQDAAGLFRDAAGAKDALRGAFRPFLIRSVRTRYQREHAGLPEGFEIPPASRIPLALLDRMLYELFEERGRTFVASALVGGCSSWHALMSSVVMQPTRRQGASSRVRLRELDRSRALGPHPKVKTTVERCAEGALGGLKTLVFVERVETGRHLRDEIERTLGGSARTDAGRRALQDRRRFGWPSLRENYLQTVYPIVFGREPDPRACPALARKYLDMFRTFDTGRGTPRDYSVEKRFWEHAYIREALEHDAGRVRDSPPELAETAERIAEPEYILNGLDLVSGESGEVLTRPRGRRRGEPRSPQLGFGRAFVRYPSPWKPHAEQLSNVPPDWRARFVDLTASAIARSHLRHEVEALTVEGDARKHFRAIERLLANPKTGWPDRFAALVRQLVDAAREPEDGAAESRVEYLLSGLRSEQRVQFVGPDSDRNTRGRAIAGFNTPLYPDILIATPVLSEGIDLHRSCRRVIHHDLPWNPARLEQRTGRIDRVGSFCENLRRAGNDAHIDVYLPYVGGTYDEFIFSRVMARRREFRCLLGNRPEWTSDQISVDETDNAMPDALVDQLQVNLKP